MLCVTAHYIVFVVFQGVDFFDEKLNALFMAWLLDHGMKPCHRILLLVVAGYNS